MEDGTSLLTTDGGENWKRDLDTGRDIKGLNLDIHLVTVKFRNHTEAWATAWEINAGQMILTTQNQGQSWETLNLSSGQESENGDSESWIEENGSRTSVWILNSNYQRALSTRWARLGSGSRTNFRQGIGRG